MYDKRTGVVCCAPTIFTPMAPRKPAPNPPLPPPLIYALFFFAGYTLHLVFPLQFLPLGWNAIPGFLLCLGGTGIFLTGVFALRKSKTPVSPYEPVKALHTEGPYLRSRNPIYLAFAWIYLGLACWTASLWPILLFPFLIFVMNRFVISREEAHLHQRFGKAYDDYRSRPRRWM
jgi:protein-S-isoprenylcysteine O-methyltransferase Ste14